MPADHAGVGRWVDERCHYHYPLDTRNQEHDYGLQPYLYDSGKRGAHKSLIAGWGDYNRGDLHAFDRLESHAP